jgi:type II secretory pathway predicted ATPase ExeA
MAHRQGLDEGLMYEKFYGLRELPFELTPNPDYLVFTPGHREALSNLQYGLSSAKTLTVLIGEPGTGKTTLVRAAMASESCRGVDIVYLANPALTRDEFVELLARRFALSPRAATSKAALLAELEALLIERRRRGQITALVVDEAQGLSTDLLEEVRLLANIETGTEKLLPLVLMGQPRLRDRLNEPGLAQLKQRVTLRCEVHPLTVEETASYIAKRVELAGGDARRLFTREAVVLLHQHSRGIPRVISVICDNALITGFASGRQPVDAATIRDVLRDFDLDARVLGNQAVANTKGGLSDLAASASTSETGPSGGFGPRRSEAATGRGEFLQPAIGKARASSV